MGVAHSYCNKLFPRLIGCAGHMAQGYMVFARYEHCVRESTLVSDACECEVLREQQFHPPHLKFSGSRNDGSSSVTIVSCCDQEVLG